MDMPLDLSIIIPVHNTEKWLPYLIESIRCQETEYTYEVIFVLDACDDYSLEIIENSGIADYIYSIDERACGIARNKGLDLAKGEYIWFIDSDDELLTKYAIQKAMDFAKGKNIVHIPFESDNFHTSCYAMVWQYIFKREFIGDTRFRREQPAEDNDFMDKMLAKLDEPMDSYDEPLYFYRYLREGSNMYRVMKGEKI